MGKYLSFGRLGFVMNTFGMSFKLRFGHYREKERERKKEREREEGEREIIN